MGRLTEMQKTSLLRERTLLRACIANCHSARIGGQTVDAKVAQERFARLCTIQNQLNAHYALSTTERLVTIEEEAKGHAEIAEKMKTILDSVDNNKEGGDSESGPSSSKEETAKSTSQKPKSTTTSLPANFLANQAPQPSSQAAHFRELTNQILALPTGYPVEEYFPQFGDILRRSPALTEKNQPKASCLSCNRGEFVARTGHCIRSHFKSKVHLDTLEAAEVGLSVEVLRCLKCLRDPECFSLLEDKQTVICKLCKVTIGVNSQMNGHLKTKCHQDAVAFATAAGSGSSSNQDTDSSVDSEKQQLYQTTDYLAQEEFHLQLVEQILLRFIPLSRVDDHQGKLLNTFRRPLLKGSTYRKQYVPKVYARVHARVLQYLRNTQTKLYMILDQRTNAHERTNTILMIGTLEAGAGSAGKVFVYDLLESAPETVAQISQMVDGAMRTIFPPTEDQETPSFEDRLLLLLTTDSSTTMKQAARSLQKKYRKMIHLACLLSGLRSIVGWQLSHLELYLEQLEEPSKKLNDSLNIVELIRYKLMDYPQFQKRVNAFLEANPGFAILESIARMKGQVDFGTLKLSRSRISTIPEITVDDLPYYTNIPLVGAEAGRALARCESISGKFRSCLAFEQVKGSLCVGLNAPLLKDSTNPFTATFDHLPIWDQLVTEAPEEDEDGMPVNKKRKVKARKLAAKGRMSPAEGPEVGDSASNSTSNTEVEDALHFLDHIQG